MDDHELTEIGYVRPGLEGLCPGLHPSGIVYAIHSTQVDARYIKVGSCMLSRVRENLGRAIYQQPEQPTPPRYLFVIETISHASVEAHLHQSLREHAHPQRADCFQLDMWDLYHRCVETVREHNERALRAMATAILAPHLDERERRHAHLIEAAEKREQLLSDQLVTQRPAVAYVLKIGVNANT
jgi:phenolic acid decarboxylase